MSDPSPDLPPAASTPPIQPVPQVFLEGWVKGVLLGLFGVALAWPLAHWTKAPPGEGIERPPARVRAQAAAMADFKLEPASLEVRHVANWALHVNDNRNAALVIVDKKNAAVYVLSPGGELLGAAPALMGSARGDHTVPGVGDKPVADVTPEERTTPAGRFVAEPGRNAKGEDIVWVDYDAAVSMHRVRANVQAERRLERLASVTAADNRISYGCINLPIDFYEQVLSPTVQRTGAVVYVLPETRPASEVFNSFDIPPRQMALR